MSDVPSSPEAPAPEVELAACKDQLLRALAEQENARQRFQRERDEAVKFAASNLARDLLATVDNLRRAIGSVPEETTLDDAARRLLAGVAATERALLDTLATHGIRPIAALGEPFDPNRHEAVFEVADSDRPAGTVAEEVQPGFVHHERLLRPAMVGVAKGSGATAATEVPSA